MPRCSTMAAVVGRSADVLAPLPAGLVGRPAERHPADLDQLEAPERELAHLVGLARSGAAGTRRSPSPPQPMARPRRTESRIAAAVTVAASGPDRERGEPVRRARRARPEARQKATSPSTSENTGSTARATPPLAIRATRVQAGLSSGASVITQTSVVLRSSTRVQSGASVIAASVAGGRAAPRRRRRGRRPAPRRRAPITSPNALTTAIAATVIAEARARRRVADPGRRRRARGRGSCPTAAPVPAPTRPRSGTPAARRLAGRVAGGRRRGAPTGRPRPGRR